MAAGCVYVNSEVMALVWGESMALEHAIYYRKTLFQWMTYTTLIGCYTHKGLIAKLINTLSEHMLCIDVVVQRLGDATTTGMYISCGI